MLNCGWHPEETATYWLVAGNLSGKIFDTAICHMCHKTITKVWEQDKHIDLNTIPFSLGTQTFPADEILIRRMT